MSLEKSVNTSRHLWASRRRRTKIAKITYSVFRFMILISIGFIVLYPLIYMFVTSISTKNSFMSSGKVWIPNEITFANFSFVCNLLDWGKSLLLTLKLEVVSALLEVISCAFVAYGFARFNFKIKKILIGLLFVTILIPMPMIIIPMVTNFSKMDVFGLLGLVNKLTGYDLRLNLLGTAAPFYLPSLCASGLRSGILIFIYMQFFKGIPKEFEEAAWVDGASPLKTFLKIIIPSSSVVILTVTIFSLIWHWNDYYMAVTYMTNQFTLTVSLTRIVDMLTTLGIYWSSKNPEPMAYLMSGCLMFILPPLILYMIIQRWFIEGIDRVGITG